MPLRWICSDFPAARLPIDYNIYECSCVRNRFTHSTQLNHSMIFRVPDDWYVLLVCARIIFRAGLRDPIFRRCLRVVCVGRLALFRGVQGVTGRCVVCGVVLARLIFRNANALIRDCGASDFPLG